MKRRPDRSELREERRDPAAENGRISEADGENGAGEGLKQGMEARLMPRLHPVHI